MQFILIIPNKAIYSNRFPSTKWHRSAATSMTRESQLPFGRSPHLSHANANDIFEQNIVIIDTLIWGAHTLILLIYIETMLCWS